MEEVRYAFSMTKIAPLFLLLFVVGCAAPQASILRQGWRGIFR